MRIQNFFFYSLCLFVLCSCGREDKEKQAQNEAKAERARAVLANQCSSDADCIITGCRQTMCRAMPEPDYCDHRIVLAMESPDDAQAVKRIVAEQLTTRESDTIRIGGYSANRWTLSFHASQAQRERVESTLNSLAQSGLARLHPKAEHYSRAAFSALSATDPDIELRTMRGAGPLIEKKIRSGDVLSKDDIRSAWSHIAAIQDITLGNGDAFERIWSYDVVFDSVSQLRLWPVDRRQRLSVRTWKSISARVDNGDIVVTGDVGENMAETLRSWTQTPNLLLLTLGTEVIAAAIAQTPIEDGRFELIIADAAQNETKADAVEMLESINKMRGAVYIDAEATASAERDISCQARFPRACACIEGYCGWRVNPDYNACLYE